MPKMLRHVKTKEVWPMNPNLARHPDVEVFDQPDPQFAAALADDADATVGDVIDTGADPVVTGEHEFDDVPDFVPPDGDDAGAEDGDDAGAEDGDDAGAEDGGDAGGEANSEDVEAKKAAIQAKAEETAKKKKAAAAKKKRAAAAKKKKEEEAAAAAAAEEDDGDDDGDDDLDLDLDMDLDDE